MQTGKCLKCDIVYHTYYELLKWRIHETCNFQNGSVFKLDLTRFIL